MCQTTVLFFLGLVSGIWGGAIQIVQNYDEFFAELDGQPNVVLFVYCDDCEMCLPVWDQLTLKCENRVDILCIAASIGSIKNHANTFTTPLKISWIPYVAFFKNGVKRAAANQRLSSKNHQYINAGFRLFKR